ncbi:hypothetical protein HQ545_08715 [Candidatus Woesearchaeota archaeon]|nr:hypothetical protein [Candidatus Woesearchaeota archaeon]
MNVEELLKKRRLLKKKKPEFIRQDAHKKKKLGWKWRKPKGSDSKMRVSRRGYKRSVRKGWGSPVLVKGLDRSGLLPVMVSTQTQLETINPKTQIMVMPSSVGTKRRTELVTQAISKGITVQNYKDSQKFLDEAKENFESRKKERKKVKEERDNKREAAKKKADKKDKKEEKKEEKKETTEKSEEETVTDDDKKMEEKKEQDKLLISKQ